MSLEGFNPDRFDDGDLWRQSKILIPAIPGLHVRAVFKPQEQPDEVWLMTGCLDIQNDATVKVTLGETVFRGHENEAFRLYWRAQDSMGKPQLGEDGVREQDFSAATDKSRQIKAAQGFLPFLKRFSLAVPRDATPEDPAPIRTLEYHFYSNACPTREHIQSLAEVNVYLAALAGQDVAPYQDIQERAAVWKPQDNMTSLSWL